MCHLNDTPEKPTVNKARLQLFGKTNVGLEMLLPTRDTMIGWHADQKHICLISCRLLSVDEGVVLPQRTSAAQLRLHM